MGSIYFLSVQNEHQPLTILQMLFLSFLFFCAGPFVRLIAYFLFTFYLTWLLQDMALSF